MAISRKDVRALVVLRLMAKTRAETGAHLRPSVLINEKLVEREWDRLDIWREHPVIGHLYEALESLARVGLIDDFAPISAWAKARNLTVPMVRGMWLVGDEPIKLSVLRERYPHNLASLELALKRARQAHLIRFERAGRSDVIYYPGDKRLRKGIEEIAPLLAKQEDWAQNYQINLVGLKAARALDDDWRHWPSLAELADS